MFTASHRPKDAHPRNPILSGMLLHVAMKERFIFCECPQKAIVCVQRCTLFLKYQKNYLLKFRVRTYNWMEHIRNLKKFIFYRR
jgi:hypothetical protein